MYIFTFKCYSYTLLKQKYALPWIRKQNKKFKINKMSSFYSIISLFIFLKGLHTNMFCSLQDNIEPRHERDHEKRLNENMKDLPFFSWTSKVPKLSYCFQPERSTQLVNRQTAGVTHRWGKWEGGTGEKTRERQEAEQGKRHWERMRREDKMGMGRDTRERQTQTENKDRWWRKNGKEMMLTKTMK